ncbi:MAG: N-acetylmuramoyl-L-alanine amidase, partial [Ferruginibacter sp.]
MMYKMAFLVLIISFSGCTPNLYKAANQSYKRQAKAFANDLKKQPADIDSSKAGASWVGTTNFSMRKPNFVIIHHTAQNSCDQTLNTFTLTRTEVSAHYVI